MLLGPIEIFGIQSCLARGDICIGWINQRCPLDEFPEEVQNEEDRNANICGKEISSIPVLVMLANKDVEAVEKDDKREEDKSDPGKVWLEGGLEHKCISINTLGLKRSMELDVGNADGAPGKEGSNGGQVLEPFKDLSWTSRADRQIRETGD